MNERSAITNLSWRRERNGWLLVAGRRRFGRVVPAKHSGMWQSTRIDGQSSDIANLSWAKNAVLAAAELELEFEDRQRRASDPPKCPERGGCFTASAPPVAPTAPDGHPVHQNEEAATSIGCGAPLTSERRS
jgi:hypothetical protein